MKAYFFLLVAILCEIGATTALKMSEQFTRLWPGVLTVAGYGVAFYCLSLALRTIPVGVAYAVWSGVGIVFIALIGWLAFKQRLDLPAVVGMAMIVVGVLIINLFSKTASH